VAPQHQATHQTGQSDLIIYTHKANGCYLDPMSIALLFWIIMLVGLIFGFYTNRAAPFPWVTNSLVLWILLALLGWKVFGAALHQ